MCAKEQVATVGTEGSPSRCTGEAVQNVWWEDQEGRLCAQRLRLPPGMKAPLGQPCAASSPLWIQRTTVLS